MTDQAMSCPVCGKRYRWYETECPMDHVALVPLKDEPPVSVFQTEDPGALSLAKVALEGAGIEYIVTPVGSSKALGWREQFGWSPDLEVPAEITVPAEDADKARDLLADLGSAVGTTPELASVAPPTPVGRTEGSIELRDVETDAVVGRITEAQLQFLRDELEEESETDRDYYFDAATIDMLEAARAESSLVAMLRAALGRRDGMELRWSEPDRV